jgi:transposase-like protein
MKHYSLERKESALQKMMPPSNMSIAKLSLDMGIGESTLYNWRKQAMNKGQLVPCDGRNAELWSSANKFAVVLETASLNEAELALYCRNKGLGYLRTFNKRLLYFPEVPYDEYHKLEKDPVYTIQQGGKPPRFTLRG